MRMLKPMMLLIPLFFSICSYAVVTPNGVTYPQFDPFKIKPKEIEKITGKKLTLFQKVKLTLAQKLLKNYSGHGEMTAKQKRQARISMILGIAGLALLFISLSPFLGFLGILSIPAAILALIFGSKSLRGNSNTEGVIGVVTGGLTLALLVLAMILIALVVSSGFM